MTTKRCFLCAKRADFGTPNIEIDSCRVPASQKPVQVVLQHLANCLKTKLVFQAGACVCPECLKELAEYDSLMLNLLTSQKRLTEQLHNMLNSKLEMLEDGEEEDEEEQDMETLTICLDEDGHLADAFNPELDAKEELIEVDDHMILMDAELVDGEEGEEFANAYDEAGEQEADGTVDDDLDAIDDDDDDDSSWGVLARRRRVEQECVICGTSFKTKFLLQSHIAEMHNVKVYTCTICGAVRRDEEYLELHMNTHEGKTENDCRYCEKSFTRPVNTLRHMRKHWDKKKYQCEKCGERFSLDNMLYNHRLRHEAEENPLICSICNQSFKSRKTFNHHVLIHQENRPRHHCALCSKSFTERYTLKMHMKTHGVDTMSTPGRDRSSTTVARQRPTAAVAAVVAVSTTAASTTPEQFLKEETEAAVTALVDEDVIEEDIDEEDDDGESNEYSCVICSLKFESKEPLEQHLQSEHDVILNP